MAATYRLLDQSSWLTQVLHLQSKEMETLKGEIQAREASMDEENARREEKAAKMLAGEDTCC